MNPTRALMALLVLTFAGCIPAGGGGGGDDDGGPSIDGAIDPDDGIPPPDGGTDDDDLGVDPDDGIPRPDRGVEDDLGPDPDDGIPRPDRGVDPDAGPDPDEGMGCDGPERCNGRDDDCDGLVDEDWPELGEACSIGTGACRAESVLVCDPRGGTICDAIIEDQGTAEVCNLIDDDCDGRVDEDLVIEPCETGEVGVCRPGNIVCIGGERSCLGEQNPRPEACDALDNDCDGLVDEGACNEPIEMTCDDGIDNDGDGHIDCRDFDCDDLEICADQVERCDNGVDDDDDGFVDCADFNCDDHPACAPVAAPECEDYVELDQANRNAAFNDGEGGVTLCEREEDEVIPGRWHRFVGPAGPQMATEFPPEFACGTHAPGWLNGAHPRVDEGIVQREACFHFFDDPCWQTAQVRVRNCGPFYVYDLPHPDACSVRYCGAGGGGPVDPPGPADLIEGVQRAVPMADVLDRGWVECHRDTYAAGGSALAQIQRACDGEQIMLACGRVASAQLTLAAEGLFEDVFFDVGRANVTHAHNDVGWYYSPGRSFGFAPGGAAVNLDSCDTNAGPERMCVHLGAGDLLETGYRCGDGSLNNDASWHRLVYTRTP